MYFRFYFILLFSLIAYLWSQDPSGYQYRKYGIHNANNVRTVFSNYGVIAQPQGKGPRGAWLNDNNGYIGDVSLMVGIEHKYEDETFYSVITCPVDRPTLAQEISPSGRSWGFEPVSGYANSSQNYIAMNTNQDSWPSFWPDKDADWDGLWNGFFGTDVRLIQQESFFVMNDNNDEEWNFSDNNNQEIAFKPDIDNNSMNGFGLEVKVRGMQWNQFLTQNCIIWLYEITNNSQTDYNKVVFGDLVGTYVGITNNEDYKEYDDDWSFFDINRNMTYTGDFDDDCSRNPNWSGDVGLVGYAFLESPGNPYDGIDNDGDATTGPIFSEDDFSARIIQLNDEVIIINDEFERSIISITESTIISTLGLDVEIDLGTTELVEGNILEDASGEQYVNPNAYDGVDNDLDGLIDENYFIHLKQYKEDQNGNVLFNEENPRRYVNYFTGEGSDDLMIDESRSDGVDNNGDWNIDTDDIGADGLANTGDSGESDGVPTDGEPNFDSTDPNESDQIGLTSFEYFVNASSLNMSDDSDLWDRMKPGYFSVPENFENGEPTSGEDGDFIFGSGYFPLPAGESRYFSMALVYGKDKTDLFYNKETVQTIYDNDYRYPPPPSKPTLTAVPGDGKVSLYWDRIAETEKDPVLNILDFEGYKLYKATDPNFNDIRNITNADGVVGGYTPLAQFDNDNEISGYFYPEETLFQQVQGYSFNLGANTGLQHHYVDEDVQNGRDYYYALVAYDIGNSADLFPAENSKLITVLSSGEIITDQNTVVVTPHAPTAGYELDKDIAIQFEGQGTGSVSYEIIDDSKLTGHTYQIDFWDTSMDQIDNDGDDVLDILDQTFDATMDSLFNGDLSYADLSRIDVAEIIPSTSFYSVKDLNQYEESFTVEGTSKHKFNFKNIDSESFSVLINGIEIDDADYEVDYNLGMINATSEGSLGAGEIVARFQYYPVYLSPFIRYSPWSSENYDSDIFDGVRLIFDNHWNIDVPDSMITWISSESSNTIPFDITALSTDISGWEDLTGDLSLTSSKQTGYYAICFSDQNDFGQAFAVNQLPITNSSIPSGQNTNFKVYDILNEKYVNYIFPEDPENGVIDFNGEDIYLFEEWPDGSYQLTWNFLFTNLSGYDPTLEDTLFINTTKPFRNGDYFQFTTPVPATDSNLNSVDLEQIKVIPNPYIAATKFESPLPPGITSGRGERKVEFQNLPPNAKIKIFTSRGQHVRTLTHNGDIHDGTVSWDLKTKENIDIAFGVYFYVVQSDYGNKKGKIAIIK